MWPIALQLPRRDTATSLPCPPRSALAPAAVTAAPPPTTSQRPPPVGRTGGGSRPATPLFVFFPRVLSASLWFLAMPCTCASPFPSVCIACRFNAVCFRVRRVREQRREQTAAAHRLRLAEISGLVGGIDQSTACRAVQCTAVATSDVWQVGSRWNWADESNEFTSPLTSLLIADRSLSCRQNPHPIPLTHAEPCGRASPARRCRRRDEAHSAR